MPLPGSAPTGAELVGELVRHEKHCRLCLCPWPWSRSPRRSAGDSGTVESEEAHGTADGAPQVAGTRRERRRQRPQTLEPAKAASSSRLTSRNLGELVNNRPFRLLLGLTRTSPSAASQLLKSIKSVTYRLDLRVLSKLLVCSDLRRRRPPWTMSKLVGATGELDKGLLTFLDPASGCR